MDFNIKNNVLIKYQGKDSDAVIPASVTSIGKSSFYGCIYLRSVEIPASVTSIRDEAFYGCRSLDNP